MLKVSLIGMSEEQKKNFKEDKTLLHFDELCAN